MSDNILQPTDNTNAPKADHVNPVLNPGSTCGDCGKGFPKDMLGHEIAFVAPDSDKHNRMDFLPNDMGSFKPTAKVFQRNVCLDCYRKVFASVHPGEMQPEIYWPNPLKPTIL